MTEVQTLLEQSTVYSFASLALQVPDEDTVAAMSALIPSLPGDLQPLAAAIVALPLDEWEPEYFSVLGPGGCPASESSYERAAIASRGPLLADVAGFYDAFAYAPGVRDVPDHASVELGFAGYLALKVAFAEHEGRGEDAAVAGDAMSDFLAAHVEPWMTPFCDALTQTGSPHYASVADFIRQLRQ
jgi:nitrate reductase assembly molybdenum cofactor insertion protein NarJ